MALEFEPVGLLDRAFSDPRSAKRDSDLLIAAQASDWDCSFAHQALGIVAREEGDIALAVGQLRLGMAAAARTGDEDRHCDVRATYGATLLAAGRTQAGLAELRTAVDGSSGRTAARVRMRLALALLQLGRHEQGVPEMQKALDAFVHHGDRGWEARTRNSLGYAELVLGRTDAAEQQVLKARDLFEAMGADVECLTAKENLGEIAAVRGDLAQSLRHYRDITDAYAAAGLTARFELVRAHVQATLAAGLAKEAVDLLSDLATGATLSPMRRADLHLVRSTSLLAMGDPDGALVDADLAVGLFRAQRRPWFELRAHVAKARAALAGDKPVAAADLLPVARALDAERANEAPLALTLAAGLSSGPARLDLWTRAASYRTHPNALVRAAAWHAQSLAHEEQHNRGGVLRAAAAGLDAIDEHRRLIGSSELRALATTHGRELTTIALRHAATEPRTLLRWSERTRATALAQPPATSDAATIPASLAALRDNGRRLAEARQEGEPTDALERERLRLERAVRAESHTLSATTAEQQKPPSVEEIVAEVGDGCLVELVDVDGTLHVLVVHAGKVRRQVAGATEEIAALLGPAAMLLRRAARGRAIDSSALGAQLQQAILGDAARLLPDGPVTLAPTARLHGLAWALLPVLGDRPFSVVPSAGQWLRARATPRPRSKQTLLISGPGLATGGAEVPLLASSHPDATLLAGRDATLDNVLRQLDGADLVHLAAHGHFRADSPLFSALDLADGPLTVHDLERVRRAPYRVVLSACESGVLAPVGAEELLGLAAALFSLGTAGLVSSVAEVNDAATADLMVELHAALARGNDPATALHEVRRSTAGDPVAAGTAAAFLALGV